MIAQSYDALSPVGVSGHERVAQASRLSDLNGKTIALLSNNQFRADQVLETVAELVKDRFPSASIIPWTELPRIEAMGDVEKRVEELTKILAERRPDAVVSSTGA